MPSWDVRGAQAFEEYAIHLNCGAVPRAAITVLQGEFELGSEEGALAGLNGIPNPHWRAATPSRASAQSQSSSEPVARSDEWKEPSHSPEVEV